MKTMKRCIVPSILLMLYLESALLVAAGRPSTATGADDVGTILLPSQGKGQAGMVASRPWKCCDRAFCTKSIPMVCKCADEVDQCASSCQVCEPSMANPSRHVCQDLHTGSPGPECTEGRSLNHGAAKAEGASQDPQVTVVATKKAEEEPRPWKCCDFALCTRSFPPICRCMDKVEQCAATCKSCEPATSDSSRRVCNDWYHGFPGAKCTEAVAAASLIYGAEGTGQDPQVTVAAEKKKAKEEERPWKCCDMALCTRSFPPICRCMDKVEQCAATCKKCEPATSDSSRRVCNDWYHGFPGGKCTAGGN